MEFSTENIRDAYNRLGSRYAKRAVCADILGLAGKRKDLVRKAKGAVLEVAVGNGSNFQYCSADCKVTGVDLSETMLELAAAETLRLGMTANLLACDAEKLPFKDGEFDSVVSTLSMCTFPHPVAAVQEMARVCVTGGNVLLLEHGLSNVKLFGFFQNLLERLIENPLGCHGNRDPLAIIKEAGLRTTLVRRSFFGIIYSITIEK